MITTTPRRHRNRDNDRSESLSETLWLLFLIQITLVGDNIKIC